MTTSLSKINHCATYLARIILDCCQASTVRTHTIESEVGAQARHARPAADALGDATDSLTHNTQKKPVVPVLVMFRSRIGQAFSRTWHTVRSFARTGCDENTVAGRYPVALYQVRIDDLGRHAIIYMNSHARTLLGLPREGKIAIDTLLATIVEEDRSGFLDAMNEATTSSRCRRHTYRLQGTDRSQNWIGQELYRDESNAKAGGATVTAYLTDLTEQMLLRGALKEARESKKALMYLFNAAMQRDANSAGGTALRVESMAVASMVAEVVVRYDNGARRRAIQLRYRVDARVASALQGYPLLLEEVLDSLVYHAVASTTFSHVQLDVRLLSHTTEKQWLSFEVVETGRINALEKRWLPFEPFGEIDIATSVRKMGSRVDLATCQTLASVMGGTISITSRPGKGTSVVLACPFALADAIRPSLHSNAPQERVASPETAWRTASSPAKANGNAARILLAESHPLNRLPLLRQLQEHGYVTEVAGDGAQAFDMWKLGGFDIVITDCDLPVMNGYALAAAIRNEESRLGSAPTYIIGCSAYSEEDAYERCLGSGMSDCLPRPVDASLLHLALSRSSAVSMPTTPASVQKTATPAELPVDVRVLATLSGGDKAFEREIYESFRSNSLADGAQIEEAMAGRDMVTASRLAHKMAGASILIGAGSLAGICRDIEQAGQDKDLQAMLDSLDMLHQEVARVNAFVDQPAATTDRVVTAKPISLNSEQRGLVFLVVEDHALQRMAMVRMLSGMGAKVIYEAADGHAAVELVRTLKNGVDIVISDLKMPNMDGMELIRLLSERTDAVSMILVSAMDPKLLASVGTMTEAYGAHLLGVVEKPLTPPKLMPLIKSYAAASPMEPRPSLRQFSLEQIAAGFNSDEFEMFFQPKVSVASGRLVGAEALMRWRHPEHGIVSPGSFIPLLEEDGNGLLDKLTWAMLQKVARFCTTWQPGADQDMTISVNLSLMSLIDVAAADHIIQIVRDAYANPAQIVLEITESAATTNLGHALENLARLRMHGFGLSIDDYGTGYSSMQQLERIAFTELKIDQSFVKNASKRPFARIILESSLAMATQLNMTSVAEGVETQADFDLLAELGCNVAQGYFIARPMDEAAMRAWIRQRAVN